MFYSSEPLLRGPAVGLCSLRTSLPKPKEFMQFRMPSFPVRASAGAKTLCMASRQRRRYFTGALDERTSGGLRLAVGSSQNCGASEDFCGQSNIGRGREAASSDSQ